MLRVCALPERGDATECADDGFVRHQALAPQKVRECRGLNAQPQCAAPQERRQRPGIDDVQHVFDVQPMGARQRQGAEQPRKLERRLWSHTSGPAPAADGAGASRRAATSRVDGSRVGRAANDGGHDRHAPLDARQGHPDRGTGVDASREHAGLPTMARLGQHGGR